MFTTLLALSLAAPVPKETKAKLYLPTKEGTKSVMVSTLGNNTAEIVEKVRKVESTAGGFVVTMEGPSESVVYEVTGKGVFRRFGPDKRLLAVLDLSKTGDGKWEVKLTEDETASFTMGKVEEIEVPAGKFQALRVDEEARTGRHTVWYAEGVGVVKSVSVHAGQVMTQELKSFTPGK